MAYNPDFNYTNSQSNLPYVCAANLELTPYGDGRHVLALSLDPIGPIISESELAPVSLFDRLFRKAYAQQVPSNAVQNLCDRENVTCCPINVDGSVECYHPLTNLNPQNINVTIIGENAMSVSVQDSIAGNALWVKSSPLGSMSTDSETQTFGVTAAGTTVELFQPTGGNFTVLGNFGDNYASCYSAPGAVQSIYTQNLFHDQYDPGSDPTAAIVHRIPATAASPGDLLLSLVLPRTSINEYDCQNLHGGRLGDDIASSVRQEADDFTVLKISHDYPYDPANPMRTGKVRFGIRTKISSPGLSSRASIHRIPDGNGHGPGGLDRIEFLDSRTSAQTGVTHWQTMAFDVDENYCALALFEEVPVGSAAHGNVRLGLGCSFRSGTALHRANARSFISGEPLYSNFSEHDIVDLITYRTSKTPANTPLDNLPVVQGNALLLDRQTNSVWQIAYQLDPARNTGPANSFITPATLNPATAIQVGRRPSAMATNGAKTRAYVANENDGTVSVLDLTRAQPAVIQTISLRDGLNSQKDLDIRPNGIVWRMVGGENQLIVSSLGLKASLVIPVEP